jgi:hypothetical protein
MARNECRNQPHQNPSLSARSTCQAGDKTLWARECDAEARVCGAPFESMGNLQQWQGEPGENRGRTPHRSNHNHLPLQHVFREGSLRAQAGDIDLPWLVPPHIHRPGDE